MSKCYYDAAAGEHHDAPSDVREPWGHSPVTWSIVGSPENDYGGKVRSIVHSAFHAWSDACGIKFKELFEAVKDDDAASADIPVQFETASKNKLFKSKPQVLGYAYYPAARKGGHVTINDSYVWGDGHDLPTGYKYMPDEYYDHKTFVLQNVLMHEIGHAIGLPHNKTDCTACVMFWSYNGQLHLQADDVRRARELYGPP